MLRTALLALVVLSACSPRVTPLGTLDGGTPPETLTLTGRVCTSQTDPTGFPTKVVLLIDQSGSMCITDPPGSQASPGFCETIPAPGGRTVPSRVTALQALLQRLQAANAQVALVPFATNVQGVWPPAISAQRFGRADDPGLTVSVAGLQAQLGKATDYQGALAYAHSVIAADIGIVNQTAPELLPRTKYVVLFVSDGVPFPRCSANDSLSTYADDAHPELTWADSPSAGTYCNTASPSDPDGVVGYVAGTDRNQNAQLFDAVDRLMQLKAQYRVGEIKLHTALLFNQESIDACGPICQDVFGQNQRWPGPVIVQSAQNGAFTRTAAQWLLQQLATRGGGTYTEFLNNTGIAGTSFAGLDTTSLAASNRLKRLFVQPLRAAPHQGAWAVDSDGDGAPDSVEAANQTSPFLPDTDGDGFGDKFELDSRAAGFDPLVKDSRGCDPASPATLGCVARDPDGDGLSQFAEAWYGSGYSLVDSDRDAFPDGVESRAGLSPVTTLTPLDDQDGDGLSDADELVRGSDPRFADSAFSNQRGMTVLTTETQNSDGTSCYAFTASNLPMVATPGDAGVPAGLSLFKIWFAEAPQGLPGDPGVWKAACAWARRDDPVLVPADLNLLVDSSYFVAPSQLTNPLAAQCAGSVATTP